MTYLSREKNWKKVSVSYLATSRIDVLAGSYIVDAYSLLGCKERTGIAEHTIPYGPKGDFKALTFISGLKTEDRTVNAKISE